MAESKDIEQKLADLYHQQRGQTPQQQQQPFSPPHENFTLTELDQALRNPDFAAQVPDSDREGAQRLLAMLSTFLVATRPPPPSVVAPVSTDAYLGVPPTAAAAFQQPVPEEGGCQTPFSEVGGNFEYGADMSHHRPFDPAAEADLIVSTPSRSTTGVAEPGSPRTRVMTGTRGQPATPDQVNDEELLGDSSDAPPLAKKYAPSAFYQTLPPLPLG